MQVIFHRCCPVICHRWRHVGCQRWELSRTVKLVLVAAATVVRRVCKIHQIASHCQPVSARCNGHKAIVPECLHQWICTQHHTTAVLRPFFRDHPGEPVPEENFLTLWCKGRLKEADTATIRLGATPSGLTSAHLRPLLECRAVTKPRCETCWNLLGCPNNRTDLSR